MAFETFSSSMGSKGGLNGMRPSAMALQGSSNYVLSWIGYILLARTLIPPEVHWVLRKLWSLLWRPYTCLFCVFHVYERHQDTGRKNDLFGLVELYLDIAGLCREADQVVLATKPKKERDILFKLTGKEKVEDRYKGVKVWWSLKSTDEEEGEKRDQGPPGNRRKKKGKERRDGEAEFVLKMHKKDKQFVTTQYLDYVVAVATEFQRQQRVLKLYANQGPRWGRSFTFKHPSTFETLAMEASMKERVKQDLDSFRRSEAYFRRVGRAWKRGYLLYGPPGTGKSSMIAAMANYLKYDVYDLELTQVHSNDSLKKLFRDTSNRSIIVIEDIDCSLNLSGRRSKSTSGPGRPGRKGDYNPYRDENVTLSGLLNSVDGLWSCSTDERIIIFTTNHVDKLDPALVRPGRMDMRIHMSYCSFESVKQLVKTYLSIDSHWEYEQIRRFIEEEHALITPAKVTEVLFATMDDPDACLRALVDELKECVNRKPNSCSQNGTLTSKSNPKSEVSKIGVVSL